MTIKKALAKLASTERSLAELADGFAERGALRRILTPAQCAKFGSTCGQSAASLRFLRDLLSALLEEQTKCKPKSNTTR